MPNQKPDTLHFKLYWIVCIALLGIVLLVRVTVPGVSLYFIILYVAVGLGAGQLLFLYEQRCLLVYLKEHYPRISEQLSGMMRNLLVFRFMFSNQCSDDSVIEENRRNYKLIYLSLGIQIFLLPLLYTLL